MADDVVELAKFCAHRGEIAGDQLDVVEAHLLQLAFAEVDLHRRQVDTHQPRLRIAHGKGDQVARRAAAQLQHPRGGDCRCGQTEQVGDGCQVLRRGLRKHIGIVWNFVVVLFYVLDAV
ncbi:hypothetical protein D9M73_276930 [compost metagenome]